MKNRVQTIIAGILIAVVLLGSAALAMILWGVHESVQEYRAVAQKSHPHPGDDVSALIDFMNSNTHSFRERNSAVWTLGRLSAPQALPALEAVYTGELCDHDRSLCQYELEKAIKRCGGRPNPPRKTKH